MNNIIKARTSMLHLALILLLAFVGYTQAQAATLTSIAVTPSNPAIDVGQTQAFTATGIFSDGSTQVLSASAKAVSAGDYHACALLATGAVECWGLNYYGQLGNGTNSGPETCQTIACSTIPVTVIGLNGATARVMAVAAGGLHSCALLASGAVECWGDNSYGQLGVGTNSGLDTCNTYYPCSTTPVTVAGLSGATAIATAVAAGGGHSCALLASGAVECWGDNNFGQLGDGTTTNSSIPVQVSGINGITSKATAIALGSVDSCAVLDSGAVECWGANNYGQLGNGTNSGPETCDTTICSTTPVTVTGLSGAAAVAVGANHACALVSGGQVQCWGDNYEGELGDGAWGSGTYSAIPVVSAIDGVTARATAISAGQYNSCAILDSGAVQCWGNTYYGQLGDGTTTGPDCGTACSASPVTVSGIDGITARATTVTTAFSYYSCAILDSGAVQCWGNNYYGQLGVGTSTGPELGHGVNPVSTTPVTVSGFSRGAMVITAGNAYSCALVAGGQVQCWGGNGYGDLGDGTMTDALTPVTVSGLSGATSIRSMGVTNCALVAGGQVQCWGDNLLGELGIGTSSGPETCFFSLPCSTTPVTVSGLSGATALATGGGTQYTGCALVAGGQVQCWGDNSYGQLGIGTDSGPELCNTDYPSPCSTTPVTVSGLSGVVAIALGSGYTCALIGDGTVQCWGDNGAGQLGSGTNTGPEQCSTYQDSCSTIPVTVSGVSGAVAIAAGGAHTCALIGDGTVQCWGSNYAGQLGDGTATTPSGPVTVVGLSGATAIAAGSDNTCALVSGGQVQCWGSNYWGQLGDGPGANSSTPVTVSGLSGATALAAGAEHNCALLSGGQMWCWGYNFDGGLGDGTRTNSSTPVRVSGLASVVWSSSDASVATIDGNGIATGLSAGTTIITATFGSISDSTTLTVNPVGPPDLVISNLAVSPSPAAVGQTVSVTATITNQGGSMASNFEVEFYKNLSSAPSVGQSGDASCTVTSLAAGASTTCTGEVSYAATGTKIIWALADATGVVTESYETNNTRHSSVAVRLPDLRVISLTVPSGSVTVNQPVTLSAMVRNASTVDVIGSFQVAIYKALSSAPGVPQTGDINCPEGSLAPQATVLCSATVTYDATGAYNVWAQADSQNTVNESYETNNVAGPASVSVVAPYTLTLTTTGNGSGTVSGDGTYNAGETAIVSETPGGDSVFSGWSGPNAAECGTGSVLMNADKSCTATFSLANPPDLVVSGITATPSPATVGQTVTITATITNQGGATDSTFVVEFYKNLSSAPSVNQPGDASCTVNGGLAAGVSTTCTGEVSYAATGTDVIWVLADETGVVTESNETNNTRHSSMSVRLPDLRVISLSVTPTTAAAGSDVTITATVENVSAVDVINGFDIDLYQDSASAPTVGQPGVFSCHVDQLAPLATVPCNTTVTYQTAGTYHVWAQADTGSTVNETNETNNLRGPVSVTAQ